MARQFGLFFLLSRALSCVVRRPRVLPYAAVIVLVAFLLATEQQASAKEDHDLAQKEDVEEKSFRGLRRRPGGVRVPDVFRVSEEDLRQSIYDTPQGISEPQSSGVSSSPKINSFSGGGVASGMLLPSDFVEADAYSRVGAAFGSVLALSDVDDTMWSSGSMKAFGKYVGGVDSDLGRGLPYPGYGALLFLLALGPHTCTNRGTRIPKEFCPVPRQYLKMNNCPIEHVGLPVVPVGPGILSARVSSSLLSSLTRPSSFYQDIEAICSRGMRHIHGNAAPSWKVTFENTIPLAYGFSSQHARGAAKVKGYTEATLQGETAVFLGDTGEKDVEAGGGMAVKHAETVAAVFIHSVFSDPKKEIEAAEDQSKNDLPDHAITFFLNVNGRKVPAVQLVYDVLAKVKEGERVDSFGDLSAETAYAAGAQIAADVRQVFLVATRKRLVALHSTRCDRGHLQPPPPVLVFVHASKLQTRVVDSAPYTGVARHIASVAKKFTSWSLKRLSALPRHADKLEEFRKEVEVQPVNHRSPLQGVTSQGIFHPLGVPFANYRSAVGAGLASYVLGMMTPQDLVSLTVASVRDLRALGPPTHCWQRSLVQGMLADVMSVEYYAGPIESRSELRDIDVYKDGVAALQAFDSFHHHHCERHDSTSTPLAVCLANLEAAITVHLANGARGSVQQLFPVLSLACHYREQLDHWQSAGSDEVESFAFLLGRALVLGMSAASLANSNGSGKVQSSSEVHRSVSDSQELQGQQQHTAASIFGEPSIKKLQRDLKVYPVLAVDYHVDPEGRPSTLSSALQLSALDAQTSEDLSPYFDDPGALFDFGLPGLTESDEGDEDTNSDKYTEGTGGGARGDSLEHPIYTREGPISMLVENLRMFCKASRRPVAIEVCGRLQNWLGDVGEAPGPDGQRSKGALPALLRVADWNTQRSQTVLELVDMGITLEPPHERPGVTGQGELDKVGALSVVGNIRPGKETVRHQRPEERAVWQRITWVLTALTDMAHLPFDTQ